MDVVHSSAPFRAESAMHGYIGTCLLSSSGADFALVCFESAFPFRTPETYLTSTSYNLIDHKIHRGYSIEDLV